MKLLFAFVEKTPTNRFDFLILWQFEGLEFAYDARHVHNITGPLELQSIAWLMHRFWQQGYNIYYC